MTAKIELEKEIPEDPVVVESFPSKGFVSTIATKYILDEIGMDVVGILRSDKLTPITMIHDYKPMEPIRIYTKDDLVLVFSEVIIPFKEIHNISHTLEDWLKEIHPKEVYLLAGISGKVTEKEHDILGLGTTDELKQKMKEIDITEVEEGMLTGISSNLLLYCFANNIPTISLMAETEYTPDPLAAASLVDVLNKFLGIEVDTDKLVEKGEKIEDTFKKMTKEMKRGKSKYKEMEGYSPMYA